MSGVPLECLQMSGEVLSSFPVTVPLECLQMSCVLRLESCEMSQSDEASVPPHSQPQVGATVGVPAHLKEYTLCQQCLNINNM